MHDSVYRILKKAQKHDEKYRRIHYDAGKLYKVFPTYKNLGVKTYFIPQPGEFGYTKDYELDVGSLILCVEKNYLVEKPFYHSGGKWPINSANGLTQGNLFFYNNQIFFISISYTYYNQHLILKKVI